MFPLLVATIFSISCLDAIDQHFGDILDGKRIIQMDLPSNEIRIGPEVIYLSDIETRNFIHALVHSEQMETFPKWVVLEAHDLGHHWLELMAIKEWRGFYFRYGPVCDFGLTK